MNDELKRVMHHAVSHRYAMVLLSNGYDDAYGRWEWLAGWSNEALAWQAGDSFREMAPYWESNAMKFFFLGYDLKNEVEALTSANPKCIAFPDAGLIIPENWMGIDRSGNKKGTTKAWQDSVGWDLPNERAHTPLDLTCLINESTYQEKFEQLQNHILDGDIYEINYCLPFIGKWPLHEDPLNWFIDKNKNFPSPFSALLKWDQKWVLCFSPERFLSCNNDLLISQPIKGTAPRDSVAMRDASLAEQLKTSVKEQSENVMIVDLMRNDLARSAEPGSVSVPHLFEIKSYPTVHQLVSTVTAKRAKKFPPLETLRLAWPMGSMTGCPKIRAMELIEEVETHSRGMYSGSIGWTQGLEGFDTNVIIRSLQIDTYSQQAAYFAGSAITALANAEQEYAECRLKASHFMK